MMSARFSFLKTALACTASATALLLAVSPAAAQDTGTDAGDDEALNEIVVTAQKRSQTIQDVAISMVALSGEQLQARQVDDASDLAKIAANVSYTSFYDSAGKPSIGIRGLNSGLLVTAFDQAPVGVYFDEVFAGARSGQLMQAFDQERIEILRGPQGTLYGRNTTGGAINYVARKPGDEFALNASAEYGRFGEFGLEGGMTVPISDTLSARVAGIYRRRDGWIKNLTPSYSGQEDLGGLERWAGRGLLEWSPSESMSWLLNVHAHGNDSDSPVYFADLGTTGSNEPNILTGYQAPGDWGTTAADEPFFSTAESHGAALTGVIDLSDAITLTSITAYDKTDAFQQNDGDGSPYSIGLGSSFDNVEFWSQELRLNGRSGMIDWVFGGYYYGDTVKAGSDFDLTLFSPIGLNMANYDARSANFNVQDSYNYAAFGDVRININEQLTLSAGLRYTYEKKKFLANASINEVPTIVGYRDADSWKAVTGRAAIEYKPNRDMLAYASYSRGFKSGGFNGSATADPAEVAPYDPEKIDAFEVGLKNSLLAGRLTANMALFYNKIDDIQALVGDPSTFFFFIRNAASAKSWGGEFELEARPTPELYVQLGIGYNDNKLGEFDAGLLGDFTGASFTFSPKLTISSAVEYTFSVLGGELAPLVGLSYTSQVWFDYTHIPQFTGQKGYWLVDATIPWRSEDGRYEIYLFGKNLTDKRYRTFNMGVQGLSSYGSGVSMHSMPRTYGIGVRFNL